MINLLRIRGLTPAAVSLSHRARLARVRRTLAVAAVAFVCGQLGIHLAVQRNWLPLRDPLFYDRLTLLQSQPAFWVDRHPAPRVLAIGSSRTHLAFDAARFGAATGCEAFNFGTPAGGPITSALYLRRLFAAGVRTDLVLIEWHPGFTSAACPGFEDRWLHAYRVREKEFDTIAGFGHALPRPNSRTALSAVQTYKQAALNRYCPVLMVNRFGLLFGTKSDVRGHMPGLDHTAGEFPKHLARTRAEYASALADYAAGGPGLTAVRDQVRVTAATGATPVVVLFPEAADFRNWYGSGGRAGIEAAIPTFGCAVIDARDWLPDTAFTDGHHLTRAAGPVFSDRLVDELRDGVRKAGER